MVSAVQVNVLCPRCEGAGSIDWRGLDCSACGGAGYVVESWSLHVDEYNEVYARRPNGEAIGEHECREVCGEWASEVWPGVVEGAVRRCA